MAATIEVRDLSHTYSAGTPFQHDAVKHMSFSVEKGEFLGIIGHTGSGKSTLAKHMNAILLPTIMEYNAPCTGEKYREIARAMGVEGVDAMTQEEYRKAACDAVRKLGQDVGIPADLKAIVKDEDVQFLAESAFADACRPGNPRDTSVEEIAALYRSMM